MAGRSSSSSSSSKTVNKQLSLTGESDSGVVASPNATSAAISNISGGKQRLRVVNKGIGGEALGDIVNALQDGTVAAVQAASAPARDIALTAAGGQTETGRVAERLVDKLALPAVALAALYVLFGRKK